MYTKVSFHYSSFMMNVQVYHISYVEQLHTSTIHIIATDKYIIKVIVTCLPSLKVESFIKMVDPRGKASSNGWSERQITIVLYDFEKQHTFALKSYRKRWSERQISKKVLIRAEKLQTLKSNILLRWKAKESADRRGKSAKTCWSERQILIKWLIREANHHQMVDPV